MPEKSTDIWCGTACHIRRQTEAGGSKFPPEQREGGPQPSLPVSSPVGMAYLSLIPLCCLDTVPQSSKGEAKGLETHSAQSLRKADTGGANMAVPHSFSLTAQHSQQATPEER